MQVTLHHSAIAANTSPLVRLLRAYFEKDAEHISSTQEQIEGILGIFQKLVANKVHHQLATVVILLSMIRHTTTRESTLCALCLSLCPSSASPSTCRPSSPFFCNACKPRRRPRSAFHSSIDCPDVMWCNAAEPRFPRFSLVPDRQAGRLQDHRYRRRACTTECQSRLSSRRHRIQPGLFSMLLNRLLTDVQKAWPNILWYLITCPYLTSSRFQHR